MGDLEHMFAVFYPLADLIPSQTPQELTSPAGVLFPLACSNLRRCAADALHLGRTTGHLRPASVQCRCFVFDRETIGPFLGLRESRSSMQHVDESLISDDAVEAGASNSKRTHSSFAERRGWLVIAYGFRLVLHALLAMPQRP